MEQLLFNHILLAKADHMGQPLQGKTTHGQGHWEAWFIGSHRYNILP